MATHLHFVDFKSSDSQYLGYFHHLYGITRKYAAHCKAYLTVQCRVHCLRQKETFKSFILNSHLKYSYNIIYFE